MFAAPRRVDLYDCKLLLTREILISGCRMSIFLYAFPIVGVIAHMVLAFEYGCRYLNTHGYTQSTNTHGRA